MPGTVYRRNIVPFGKRCGQRELGQLAIEFTGIRSTVPGTPLLTLVFLDQCQPARMVANGVETGDRATTPQPSIRPALQNVHPVIQ